MHRLRRATILGIIAIVLGLITSGGHVARAHALLLRSDPAPDVVLPATPPRIHLWFSESLNGSASRIAVWDRYRHVMNQGNAVLVPGRPRELEVGLKPLSPGSYLVLWTSVSAEDGHILRGSYLFSVKVRGPGPSLAGVSSGNTGQSFPDAAGLGTLLAHWLELIGAVLWAGAAAFSALIFPATARRRSPAAMEAEAVRVRTVLRASILTLLLASSTVLLLQAYSLAGGDWSSALSRSTFSGIFAGQYGHLWAVRQGIALLALAATFAVPVERALPSRYEPAIGAGERGSLSLTFPGMVLLGFVYLFLLAASGHAASAEVGTVQGSHIISAAVFFDWLHLLGVGLWFGGQLYIALVLIPSLRPSHDWRRNAGPFLDTLNRFSPVAYASIGIFALTGTFNGKIHIASWTAFFNSIYGRALMVKIGLIGLMMLISAYHVYRLRPRIRRELDSRPPVDSSAAQMLMTRLVRWLRLEPCLGVGVLLAVSVMFYYPVPASVSAQGPQWRPAGLSGVLVHYLVLGHRHPALAFAAAHGGVYRRDPDQVWQRVLVSGEVWGIDLLPDDRTVIAATEAGDVFLSHDSGNHWRKVAVTHDAVYAVTAQPGNPRHFLAGAGGGIYLSRDGGRHWRRRLRLKKSAGTAFAWQPGSTRVVFAGTVSGGSGGSTSVLVSRDAGMTWRVFGSHLNSWGGVMSLALTPQGSVFAGTMGNAVWRTSRAGKTWNKVASGMPPTNDHAAGLATIPGEPGTMFVGTLGNGVYRTSDRGRHWTSISGGLPAERNATTVLSVAYSSTQDALYAGTADGVYELTQI